MKREADGEMGSPQKRSRRGDEEIRLLIPSKAAGSIIGKGGSNITKLRNQYHASITVPDCPGPERMLTLSTDSVQNLCQIIRDVLPNLEANGGKSEEEMDLRMMIHQSQAGCVIGRAGAKIKDLRSDTGARIKIFTSCAPQSSDRIIQINGRDYQCIDAITEIIKLTKSTPIKGAINPYNPRNYDEYWADEYGGFGTGQEGRRSEGGGRGGGGGGSGGGGGGFTGRNGSTGPSPGGRQSSGSDRYGSRAPSSRASLGGYSERRASPPRSSGGYGGSNNRTLNGGSGLNNGFERSTPAWLTPLNGSGGNDGGGGLQAIQTLGGMLSSGNSSIVASNLIGLSGGGGSQNGSPGNGSNTTQVTIPKNLAGAIIGKGGNRIRKIRQDSGAGITIDEPLPGCNERIITISGMPNQIQMAQYLLQQSVHNNADQRNGFYKPNNYN